MKVVLQQQWLRIRLKDQGPGISEEFKSLIFKTIFQADSSDAKQKGGTGSGLALVKQ